MKYLIIIFLLAAAFPVVSQYRYDTITQGNRWFITKTDTVTKKVDTVKKVHTLECGTYVKRRRKLFW